MGASIITKRETASFDLERAAWKRGLQTVAGVDEAGRGPWAGPVVAAAVILDPDDTPNGIADSKQLDETAREALFAPIMNAGEVGIGIADVARIDRDNILAATLWAMSQAVARLPAQPDFVLIDGNRSPALKMPSETIVKGDARSLSIAAASIIAKVTRDRMMHEADKQYPGYGFGRHKGYGTKAHSKALEELGVTPLHRRSFKPIRELIARTEA